MIARVSARLFALQQDRPRVYHVLAAGVYVCLCTLGVLVFQAARDDSLRVLWTPNELMVWHVGVVKLP